MSYTGTQAQTGNQTTIGIKSGETYTSISEVISIAQSGRTLKTADATNLMSTAVEWIATLQDPGKYELTMNRVSADAGQAALYAAFTAKAITAFEITLPLNGTQTTGDKYAFSALVDEYEDVTTVDSTKQVTTKAGLKVSGSITFTPGSTHL